MKIKNRNCAAGAGFILLLSIVLASFLPAPASGSALKQTEIIGIEVLDNTIQIKADAPIKYKLYRPEDPFRITVDIEGARLGKFVDKMFPARAGITEIEPIQILEPATVGRFNILLQSPAIITPEVRDTVLVLTIKSDGMSAAGTTPDVKVPDDGKAAGPVVGPAYGKSGDSEAAREAAGEIVELLFSKTDNGAKLVLKGDGEIPDPRVIELKNRVIIEIPDILVNAPLPHNIAAPVKAVSYDYGKDNLRVIIDLADGAKASVEALDDELVVDITSTSGGSFSGAKAVTARKTCMDEAVKKQMVSFDVQDADIVTLLRLLSYEVTGCNIVVNPEDVKGRKITMKLENVPWDQALSLILKTFNLDKIVEGNVIRIATTKTFQEEQKSAAETRNLLDMTQEVFVVNYANVDKVKETIDKAKILTPRGNLSTDPRTRSIIVNDVPASLEEVRRLIAKLDKPTRQVLIEARIVEVSKNFSNELGVQWSGYWSPTATKSAFDLVGSTTAGATGTNGSRVMTTVPSGIGTSNAFFPTLVDLGASAPTGAFTVGYLNAKRTLGLDLRLSALESNGKGRVISNPKIMTVDNEKAVIKQGRRIPYQTSSANTGPVVNFVDASLDLIVTPQVGPDMTVLLNIQANKNEADFANQAQGMPTITTSEASTQVLIKDGETVVIGGVFKTSESESEDSVPGISRIPLLGALFKHTSKSLTTSEQLIFITPRVIELQ